MAEIPVFPMPEESELDDLTREMLKDLAELTGIPFEEIAEPEPEFWTGEIGERELEAAEKNFELENEYGDDSADYLDDLMDDLDVDPGDEDLYTED